MKIIIPMAGRGTRLRPHTLTTPKPLIPIAGKAIVHRLVEDLASVCNEPIDEIGFVVGELEEKDEQDLASIAKQVGAQCKIYHQEEALGTAHAILTAKESLDGRVIVAFADTLFNAAFKLDTAQDGIILVHKVANPSAFGVVKLGKDNRIEDFVEKPEKFISDLAIIGIYYFKDGENLKNELQYLVDNKVTKGGEYQLTDALENMKNKNLKFVTGQVTEWLDCGNKEAAVHTNQRYLEYLKGDNLVDPSAKIENSILIEPVYIGPGAHVKNAVVGPHVSIGENTTVKHSLVKNSIVQASCNIENAHLANSMLGNFVVYEGVAQDISVGDYNQIKI
jgi:glucose-1-phosphate thymidylyltransferase